MSITGQSPGPSLRSWRSLFIAASALMLTACGQLTPPSLDRPPLPADLTAPCPDLTPLSDGTAASVLLKLSEISQSYYDCKAKQAALAEAVK